MKMVNILCEMGSRLTLVLLFLLTSQTLADDDNSSNQGRDILYFGFFFDETTASSMKFVTDSYFNSSLSNIPEFSDFLKNITHKANLTDPFKFYEKPLDPNTEEYDPLYHVTAKYCGTHQRACAEYEKKNSQFIDTKFEMNLIGYVLTSRTFGIRVRLTDLQKELFDGGNGNGMSVANTGRGGGMASLVKSSLPGEIDLERQQPFPPILPAVTTRAHVTLGCAPGVSAVITGPDALQAIEYERNNGYDWKISWDNIKDPMDSEGGNMRVTLFRPNASSPYNDYLFVIYPRVKVVANATLSRYYQKSSGSGRISAGGSGTGSFVMFLIISVLELFQ